MSNLPIMSVSGIRGIFGETIDEQFVSRIAYIQTRLSGGETIVIGRDTRPSGTMLLRAVCRGIRAAGGKPVDIGIAPTPTTCVAVNALNASGGIILTASHNPAPYNGYKMVHSSGRLYGADECLRVYEAFHNSQYPPQDQLEKFDDSPAETVDASIIHVNRIISKVDADLIASSQITIAVDSINGAAGAVFPRLLDMLSVRWIGINNKLDGDFVHNPEPRPEYLEELSSLMQKENSLWGGFIFDPDADRLATMGEKGEPVSEEMTLIFALDNILERTKTDIATNLSTSMLADDVGRKYGSKVFRTRIGEANVVDGMVRYGCAVGGEGNGGVIYPAISMARDGIAALALILELMARRGEKITSLASSWPAYAIVKDKIPCESIDPADIIDKLIKAFPDEQTDLLDGFKIIRDYGWVHLRSSNTEPIIRCYAEAKSDLQARELISLVMKEVNGFSE